MCAIGTSDSPQDAIGEVLEEEEGVREEEEEVREEEEEGVREEGVREEEEEGVREEEGVSEEVVELLSSSFSSSLELSCACVDTHSSWCGWIAPSSFKRPSTPTPLPLHPSSISPHTLSPLHLSPPIPSPLHPSPIPPLTHSSLVTPKN